MKKNDPLKLSEEDLKKIEERARREAHIEAMKQSSVRGGAIPSKKVYNRKKKHKKKEEE